MTRKLPNAYKYAFTGRDKGDLGLSSEQKNQLISLKIIDDGVGLSEDFNLEDPDSLGIQLINVLTKQLEGNLRINQKKVTVLNLF